MNIKCKVFLNILFALILVIVAIILIFFELCFPVWIPKRNYIITKKVEYFSNRHYCNVENVKGLMVEYQYFDCKKCSINCDGDEQPTLLFYKEELGCIQLKEKNSENKMLTFPDCFNLTNLAPIEEQKPNHLFELIWDYFFILSTIVLLCLFCCVIISLCESIFDCCEDKEERFLEKKRNKIYY